MGSNERRRRMLIRQIVGLVLGIAALTAAGVYYYRSKFGGNSLTVRFVDGSGAVTQPFHLRVAHTEAARRKGLMFVKEGQLAADAGMLFVFPREEVHTFWMKDTYIPLDMLFLNGALKVVGALEQVPILDETQRKVDVPSRYVVELPAGTAAKSGIRIGSLLKVDGPLPAAR